MTATMTATMNTSMRMTTTMNTTNLDFETLALPHLDELFRSARHTLGNQAAAEDVVQETYLQAWRSFSRFTPGTNIRAWLFKILYHVINHHWRKQKRLVTLSEEDEYLFEQLPYVPPVSQELRDEDLLAALARVPEYYRDILLLADVQEFAYKEIAAMLGIPLGTVMSRLSRARKLLRQHLAGDANGHGGQAARQAFQVSA
jgi:RNA polymerase sigma-70 factor (ECF subfamily)